jgi:Domain of unknown function (DUF1708)
MKFPDSNMARDSFATFIPLSVDSDARSKIIFDFFDLLSAIAAHAKTNGLGGRKLSRLAGWWAFEHSDVGHGFEGGYKGWASYDKTSSYLQFFTNIKPELRTLPVTCSLPIFDLNPPTPSKASVGSRSFPCLSKNLSRKPNIHLNDHHYCNQQLQR